MWSGIAGGEERGCVYIDAIEAIEAIEAWELVSAPCLLFTFQGHIQESAVTEIYAYVFYLSVVVEEKFAR